MNLNRALVIALALVIPSSVLNAQVRSAYLSPVGTSAMDIKGVRHHGNDYPRKHPPWMDDQVQAFAPDYPYVDRALHHEGTGLFRLTLDINTGSVSQARLLKSTGFRTLDNCAIASLRRWRWKAGKWKEIDMPVTFKMGLGPPKLPAGATPLPRK
jgi:TonB family protein